jgi:putative SOS response-associated peptidase YedK
MGRGVDAAPRCGERHSRAACYTDVMCGRFTQRYTWREIQDLYGLMGAARNLQAHYNLAPTDTVDAVIPGDGANRLVSMRWGLVPFCCSPHFAGIGFWPTRHLRVRNRICSPVNCN